MRSPLLLGAFARVWYYSRPMLVSLLWAVLAQVPCAPSDSTVVCQCKQGVASACDVLAETQPELAKDILRLLAMSKAAQETSKDHSSATVDTGCGQPPDDDKTRCTGQLHHVISRTIHNELKEHATLKGLYQHRDPRFVTRAVDQKAHCGWWGWHQKLDQEIAAWIRRRPNLTREQFEAYLREVYARPELRARFPNGF